MLFFENYIKTKMTKNARALQNTIKEIIRIAFFFGTARCLFQS